MEDFELEIDGIYIPAKYRGTLDSAKVETLAESILENGLQVPIGVRNDGRRYVLVSGLHRLEACRALGETKIRAVLVGARRY